MTVVYSWVGNFLNVLLLCRPVTYNRNRKVYGYCNSTQLRDNRLVGFFSMVLDASIVLLPILVLWELQMDLKRKIGVLCVFGTSL